MISNYQIRQNATVPFLEVQITKDGRVPLFTQNNPTETCAPDAVDSNVVDLTDATSVVVEIVKAGRFNQPLSPQGEAKVADDAKTGVVSYQWAPSDTAIQGLFYVTFVISFGPGRVLRWPFQPEALSVEIL